MEKNNKPKLIVVLGPTASGKSDLALELAKKYNGELIAADSRQIYKYMDIGTNKDMGEVHDGHYLVNGIPIYMFDVITPDKDYSVAEYKEAALARIKDIHERGKLPIMVGGTGLYIQAVVDNLNIPEVPPDKELRKMFEEMIKNEGLKSLWHELIKLDPEAEEIIDKDNPRRVIRALEVCRKTGRPFSAQQKKGEPLFDVLQIGIKWDRKKLYERIDLRAEKMFREGLLEETKMLMEKGYPWGSPAMSGIGYKEAGDYLRGKISLEEAVQKNKWRNHQYARRQEVWFKRDGRIKWVEKFEDADELVSVFLH